MTLIYFILILGLIILVHEFGHFIFAKMFGVYVYEFSLGMGPKIISKKDKKGETEYSLRAIPIGGFVQLAGEEVDDDEKIPKNRKVYAKPIWQRFLIMFFGAGNNFILAFLILLLYAFIWGSPNLTPVLRNVTPSSPFETAGIDKGDVITAIDGNKITTIDDISIYLAISAPGEALEFTIENPDGSVEKHEITPELKKIDGVEKYYFGIELGGEPEKGFLSSFKYAFEKTGALFKQMFITLKALFTGKVGADNLSGPVGIYSIVGQSREAGLESVFQLIALLSLNVGFINLIPFPAFDGGRILFLLIEKIKGSPVNPKVENIFHTIGFMLLIGLMLYITFNDVIRIIK